MAKFNVNPDNLKASESEFALCSSEIRKIADAVKSCQQTLAFSSGATAGIRVNLQNQYDNLLTEAAKMDSFKEAILKVADFYDNTETRIINGIAAKEVVQFGASAEEYYSKAKEKGTDKRSNWQKFWDWALGRDVDTKYAYTTKEKEEAADRELQRQIANLSKKEKYTQEYWMKASIEERKQILQDYMHDIEKIMGIDVKSKIKFTNTPAEDGLINFGAYNPNSNRISINEYILENYGSAGSYALMATIVHECRHAYQHSAIDHPTRYVVSQETIDSWKKSFKTYEEECAKGNYFNIVVEKDARRFAGQS